MNEIFLKQRIKEILEGKIKIGAITLLLSICFWGGVSAQDSIKHLFLGNDTHTDLMWNGDEDQWYAYNLDMARFYLKLGEGTREKEPGTRSTWNYDVAWTLYMMEQRTSKDFFDRIIAQIKNGQASVPYNFTLSVYGASTMESVLRSFYYGGHLERKYGIDIDLAVCQENATLPLGLASLWAGSGARYSWRGVCNCATQINTVGVRDQEIYWYTGLDSSRILMKWYSNFGWNAELGGYSEMLEPTLAVMQMDTMCGSVRYPYFIAAAFGKGWDNIHNYSYDLVWGLQRRTLPGTRVYLSNQTDFFQTFESRYGGELPVVTLAHGNEWDLNLASLSEVSGQLKRSMEKLRTAEMMAALVSASGTSRFEGLLAMKDAFNYGLGVYFLHGWTADGPINRHDFASYMRTQQQHVTDYADTLYEISRMEMGRRINAHGMKNRVFVFNPLNWTRSGLVDIPVKEGYHGIKDPASNQEWMGSIIEKEGTTYLRIWLDDIPATGYRVLQLIKSTSKDDSHIFTFSGDTLQTPYYTAAINRSGSISSLWDKKLQKNWIQGAFNDLGSIYPGEGEEILIEDQGNHHITLLCRSEDPVKHECRLTFYAEDPRIDIQNMVLVNFNDPLHWSFSYDMDEVEVWHEEVGAVIQVELASAGGHYADRMARYDYLSLNHFVHMGNKKGGITLSNADCLFFKLGNSTPETLDTGSSTIHILAGGQVNKANNLGIIGQDGDSVFHQHFSIRPFHGSFNPGASMRFSLEHQNPFTCGPVLPGGDWDSMNHSFIRSDNNNVILWTLKPGEEDGTIVRYWNMEPEPVTVSIDFAQKPKKVTQTTHVETEIVELPFSGSTLSLDLNQHQLKTIKVSF